MIESEITHSPRSHTSFLPKIPKPKEKALKRYLSKDLTSVLNNADTQEAS